MQIHKLEKQKINNGILFNLSFLSEETMNNIINIIKAPKFIRIHILKRITILIILKILEKVIFKL